MSVLADPRPVVYCSRCETVVVARPDGTCGWCDQRLLPRRRTCSCGALALPRRLRCAKCAERERSAA